MTKEYQIHIHINQIKWVYFCEIHKNSQLNKRILKNCLTLCTRCSKVHLWKKRCFIKTIYKTNFKNKNQ